MNYKYLSFLEAREYVRLQKLKNTRNWEKWSNGTLRDKLKKPDYIPLNPNIIYKNHGWVSWEDWIKEDITIMYLSFDEAREYIRKLDLKSTSEWQRYYQGKIEGLIKPNNIPWNPKKIYEKEWKGIKNWLGIDWRDFHEARSFVRSLNLKGQKEWRMYYKGELKNYELKPLDIPTDPQRSYNNEWIDMYDWLGKSK